MPANCPTGGVRKPGHSSSNPSLAEDDSRGCELPDASNLSHTWAQQFRQQQCPQVPWVRWRRLSAERIQGDTKSIRLNTIVTVNAKAHTERPPGYLCPLGKVGSSSGLFQPIAEELSQDQGEVF